jgi:hypothetical protein
MPSLHPPSPETPWPIPDSQGPPWSDNPYAPQIPYAQYFAEKVNFAGVLIGAIFYGTRRPMFTSPGSSRLFDLHLGIVIVLFFQCMGALLNPVNRAKGGIKWSFVAHTTAMFSFVTIFTVTTLDIRSISYIDNRDFPGEDGVFPPGPVGYLFLTYSNAISITPKVMFLLNNSLADGLLVSYMSNPTAQVFNLNCYSSSTVATFYTT